MPGGYSILHPILVLIPKVSDDNIPFAFYRIGKGQDKTQSGTSENGQESSKSKDELDFDTNFSSADSDEDSDVLEEQFKSMNFETTEI